MNILLIGDVVGRPGRELVRKGLRALIDVHGVDFVIANAENAAAGFGVTKDIGDSLLGCGIDVMTSENHIWDKKEVIDYIKAEPPVTPPGQLSGWGARSRQLCRERVTAAWLASSTSWVASSCFRSTTRLRWCCAKSTRFVIARASSSSTFTRRRRVKRLRWDGTSTVALRR